MKISIPKRGEVQTAFRTLYKRLDGVLKATNESAARRVRLDDYDGAEAWVQIGVALHKYELRVSQLENEWKALCRNARERKPGPKPAGKKGKLPKTPLWEFYQPILKALVALGGDARRDGIEPKVLSAMESHLQPGDLESGGGGRPNWQNCVRRARKHLVKEGWLSPDGSKGLWRITEKGRQAASRQRQPAGTP